MGESYRRLISKPVDISDADTAALADRLARDVQLQRELAAQSPHVLQFTSELKTNDEGFYVEHEPAIVHPIPYFIPDAAVAEEEDLLRWAIALADSLRVAHTHPQSAVHGGLCPGVIVTTPDGIQKVTDFGFAPSICAALGVDSFLNLCVRNRADDSGDVKETGVWEIVSPDNEQDDRICGFVDPQKYGNQTLHTFEPMSDIIGAGIILHLMAENRHPYLPETTDLRLPALAESMAWEFYDGSRRKSLQNSPDDRVKIWCEIVAKMLERMPDDRPDAATITTRLAEVGVEKHSLADLQNRKLDAIASQIEEQRYQDAHDAAQTLTEAAESEEIAEKAKALLRSADAGLRLANAAEHLKTDTWSEARKELQGIELGGLHVELVQMAEAIESRLGHLSEIDDRLNDLESSFRELSKEKSETADDAKRVHASLDSLLGKLTALGAETELPSQFLLRSDTLRNALDDRLETIQQTITNIDADHAAARNWLADLQKAKQDDRRDRVRELLAGRDGLGIHNWPQDVITAGGAVEKYFEEFDLAESWLARFSEAVQGAEADDSFLSSAQSCLGEKPRISEWPGSLRENLESVAARLSVVESIAADRTAALQWLDHIKEAVASEDWATANRELAAKPSLRHWPDEALAEVERIRPIVDGHLEEQERVQAWVESAENAANNNEYKKALEIIISPPVSAERLPKKIRTRTVKLQKEWESRLEEARKRALEERTEVIREKARALVRGTVERELSRFLSADSMETIVDPVEWDSADMASAGHGDLTVTIRFERQNEPVSTIRENLQFELNDGLPQILHDQSLCDRLTAELRRVVHQHQLRTATKLAEPLQQGLFPDAAVKTSIAELTEKTMARISFLDPRTTDTVMETALVWDAKRADWAYADPESVAQRAVEIAASSSKELLKPKLLETSELLRRYSSVIEADVTAPPPPSPPAIPRTLNLEGHLTFRLNDDESALLMTFPFACKRAGEVTVAADLRPAESKLNEIVVARQQTAQASVIQHLEERLSGATVRCKLTPLVKRIKTPVDEVGFLLKPKRGEKITLTATWNRDRFLFELGEQAEAELMAVLNGSAATKDSAPPRSDSTKASTSTGKRPAVAVVGVVILLAMAGAGYMFFSQAGGVTESGPLVDATTSPTNDNSSPITLPTNDNATDNGPALVVNSNTDGTTPDPNPNDNADTPVVNTVSATVAIEKIKEALAASAYLQDGTSEFVDQEASIENGVATLGYRVPGLQPVDRQVPLVASNDVWSIGLELQLVVQSHQELTSLLDADHSDQFQALVRDVVNRKLGRLMTPAAVSVAGITPSWQLDESRRSWVAHDETATISINKTDETVTIPGLSFTAKDGSVSLAVTDDLRDDIQSALNDAIVAIQVSAANSWLSGLEDIGVPPEAVQYPEIGADPRPQIHVGFSAPNLQTRKYFAEWIPASLTFARQEWKLSAGRFARALAAINALNDENQRPSWVRQVQTIGVFSEREGAPSTANVLQIVTTAPWADDAGDVQDQLALRIPLDSTDSDIPMPRRWPLIVRYQRIVDHPMIAGPTDPAIPPSTLLWTELPAELTPLVDAGLAAVQLDATIQGKPLLIAGDSPQLDMRIVLSWRRSPLYEDISSDAAMAGLDVLTGGKGLSYGLSLTLDAQGEVVMGWTPDANNNDDESRVDAIVGYDRLLLEYSDRLGLEARLASRLSSDSAVPLQPDQAVQFLIEIWNIKNKDTAPAAPDNLRALTRTIRRLRGFSAKGRDRGHDSPIPTVFVEYFCGPQSTFAIVWSTTETDSLTDSSVEGPTLVQLGATSDLISGADVGALLLDPVFDRVPEAVEPQLFGSFQDVLGVLLALDAPLELLLKDPADLKLSTRNSALSECDPDTRGFTTSFPWDSLRSLRDGSPTKRSDFKLVPALITPNDIWQRESNPDLIEAARDSRIAFQAAVKADKPPLD